MKKTAFVAILGRPNVGKSTLLNNLLGGKLSITSNKPQTTRHKILGIKTQGDEQIIYVDTPGLHSYAKKALNRVLNKTAKHAARDVDIILFMIEALQWTEEDEKVLALIKQQSVPVILVINKLDRLKTKEELLPFIEKISCKTEFADIIPISAEKGINIDRLEIAVRRYLSESDFFYYPEEQITDRDDRFFAAEIIREKIMRFLSDELPYSTTVSIEMMKKPSSENKCLEIYATIWVEREGQKMIVLGKEGHQIKAIGQQARKDIEHLFGQHVFLKLWVKVRQSWADDERSLRSLGYDD